MSIMAPIPHQALQSLLARYGLANATARRIAHLDVQVFKVQPPGATPPLGLRIYGPNFQDAAQIQAELAWLQAAADLGLQVPAPVADPQGERLHRVPWVPGGPTRFAVMLKWLPGRCLTRSLQPRHAEQIGRTLARLHTVAEGLQERGRLTTRAFTYRADPLPWADGSRPPSPRLPPATTHIVRRAAATLAGQLEAISSTPPAFIHGDVHLWNLLFAGGQAGVIDFSGCGRGHVAQELAAPLQYLKHPLPSLLDRRADYLRLKDALLHGYAAERRLPDRVEQQIDTFIGLRCLGTLEWVLDDWPKVNHRAWGPSFLREADELFKSYVRT